MASLARFLSEKLPGIPVTHIRQGLTYAAIGAAG
jgi:hypothetical protein